MNLDRRMRAALNHLAAFEAAVDAGGFTRAAARLGATQPSVSRHVAALEALLEVKLFTRLHHRVELTEAGRDLHDAVKLGLGHIRQAAGRIAGPRGADTLSVGCSYGFAHLWLMPRFSALQKLLPAHELRMITADAGAIFDLDEIDFALRFGDGRWRDGDSARLFGEQLFPVCSPDFAQRHFGGRRDVDPAALPGVPLIHERPDDVNWLSWREWLARRGVEYQPPAKVYLYDNYALTLQAATEGLGVALAWLHLAEPPLKSGQLVELEGLRVRTDNGYWLAHRAGHPMAATLTGWFQDMARRQEAANP